MSVTKNRLMHLFFLFIIAGVFISGAFQIKTLEYISKPLIMIWIASYFFLNSNKTENKILRITLVAFLFSWIGDILLMFGGKGFYWFLSGLVSFLVSQIIYTILFKMTIKQAGTKSIPGKKFYWISLYFLYGLILYFILFTRLDNILRIAVFIYMIAILTMSAMAFYRKDYVNSKSFWFVFSGSVLFIISDSLIAINKFYTPVEFERIWIMGTYISAQYLIMRGLLKSNK